MASPTDFAPLLTQLRSILRLIKLNHAEALPAMNSALRVSSNRTRGSDSELPADGVRVTCISLRRRVYRSNHVASWRARWLCCRHSRVMRERGREGEGDGAGAGAGQGGGGGDGQEMRAR